ncbi:hypothetical protein DFH06DRAFT_141391 [Mycena polygramma]|nr:hypothetical protein DFH06DRAFT_141391 [Mycena polygramma]
MDPAIVKLIGSNLPPTDLQLREMRCTLDSSRAELLDLEQTVLKVSLILSELECQRSIRRKAVEALLGALSPIRRIPTEILSTIFLRCRDNSLRSWTYCIADSREAPMVLGQVSSRWRSVCHGTPLLWDRVCLMSGYGQPMPGLPRIQRILALSRNSPVAVWLATRYGDSLKDRPVELAPEPAVGLFTGLHSRLKAITLDICTSNLLPPHNLHQDKVFPILTSLEITFADPDGELDITSALKVFSNAPCLQSVELISHCLPRHSPVNTLPWAQLTDLRLHMVISLRDARAILAQCQKLQTARISDCTWSEDWAEGAVELPDLRSFNFHMVGDEDDGLIAFFESFSFPNLRELVISACGWSPLILPNLLHRSQFKLESLVLTDLHLAAHDLLEFLRRLPTLQDLTLSYCAIDDELFGYFTLDIDSVLSRLTLPHLRHLGLTEFTDMFAGISVASMAESLCLHSGRPTSAFPVLRSVMLSLHDQKFDADVERRLAAACSTGLIIDDQARMRI